MDFFTGLSKTLEEAARQVGEKSGEIWESGRLNFEIYKEEEAIRRIHRKIGEQVYADYEKGQGFSGRVTELCDEIKERKSRINRLKAKLSEIGKPSRQSGKPDEQQTDQKAEHEPVDSRQQETGQTSENRAKEPEISYYEAVERMQKIKQGDLS